MFTTTDQRTHMPLRVWSSTLRAHRQGALSVNDALQRANPISSPSDAPADRVVLAAAAYLGRFRLVP